MNVVRRCALVLVLGAVLAVGCKKPAVTPAAAVTTSIDAVDDAEVAPVLQDLGPPDLLAVRVCQALHGAPIKRRGACCGVADAHSATEATCVSQLSALVKGRASSINANTLAACEAAQAQTLSGCAWVRALAPAPPSACSGLITGTLDDGARCRSSLECRAGLRCHGASGLDVGRCGAPRAANALCGSGMDAMGLAVGVADVDRDHPACQGFCRMGRCASIAAAGARCTASIECGATNRCEAGVCKTGRLARGAACSSQVCDDDDRCISGKCAPFANTGDSCSNDFDCSVGGCVKPKGAQATDLGTCGMRCTVGVMP